MIWMRKKRRVKHNDKLSADNKQNRFTRNKMRTNSPTSINNSFSLCRRWVALVVLFFDWNASTIESDFTYYESLTEWLYRALHNTRCPLFFVFQLRLSSLIEYYVHVKTEPFAIFCLHLSFVERHFCWIRNEMHEKKNAFTVKLICVTTQRTTITSNKNNIDTPIYQLINKIDKLISGITKRRIDQLEMWKCYLLSSIIHFHSLSFLNDMVFCSLVWRCAINQSTTQYTNICTSEELLIVSNRLANTHTNINRTHSSCRLQHIKL